MRSIGGSCNSPEVDRLTAGWSSPVTRGIATVPSGGGMGPQGRMAPQSKPERPCRLGCAYATLSRGVPRARGRDGWEHRGGAGIA
jgi:hypothetical protein